MNSWQTGNNETLYEFTTHWKVVTLNFKTYNYHHTWGFTKVFVTMKVTLLYVEMLYV